MKPYPRKVSQQPPPPVAEAVEGDFAHTTILIRYPNIKNQIIVVPTYEADGVIRFFNAPAIDRRNYSNEDKWMGKK